MKQTAAIIFRSVVLLLAGIVIGLLISNNRFSENDETIYQLSGSDAKLNKVMQIVRKKYVDSINTDSVEGVAINNLLHHLDPHSAYLQQRQAQSLTQQLQGGFDGIGIESQLLRDTLFVTQVYPNGPAASANLPNGSRVITLNGKRFSGTHLTSDKISDAFNSGTASELTLGVMESPLLPLKTYRIKRNRINLSSLDIAYLTAPGTGYIKISKFGAATDEDFRKELAKLKAGGMQKLILDLRGNGGGYLNSATALADEFLPKGKTIVYTQGLHEPRTDYFSTDSGAYEEGKLAILIDEHSASASEILAGALQDLDRAVIVGRRSFGKGLVQEQFKFTDGSALNLTVARYYTPSGRSIQKSYKSGLDNYRNELIERQMKGELYTAQNNLEDSSFVDTTPYHTAAGKKVYGGGGIMPDVFVPEDPAVNSQLLADLNRNRLFTAYAIDRMQPQLSKYTGAADYIANYNVSDDDLTRFIIYATGTLKQMDSHELGIAKNYIKLLIKAKTARFKWGNEAYYKILNEHDEGLAKAIAAL